MTWSKVEWDPSLTDSNCQASIIRMTTEKEHGRNRILFLNPSSRKRENMALRVSQDEAKTWGEPMVIHAGPAAYSDLAVLPDLSVGTLYENGKIWPYSKITFTRLEFDRVTRGEK